MTGRQQKTSSRTGTAPDRRVLAETISSEAKTRLAEIMNLLPEVGTRPRPSTLAEWDARQAESEMRNGPFAAAIVEAIGISRVQERIGGVPTVRIRSRNHRPGVRTHVYLHGGGYVTGSASSSLIIPSLIADRLGEEVVSIDYTLAPRGNWRKVTDEVLAVWAGLLQSGLRPGAASVFGDSAGGGLAAGSVLKMRDQGLPLPGALWLLSPWSDITPTGDTWATLADKDPTLDPEDLVWCAKAYANEEEQTHPYVSPVYGDYSRAFPPTLVQAGTREIFLSHAVRHYQAIQQGGHVAVLDIYEGMPHVFQALAAGSPEADTAIMRAAHFLDAHLEEC